MLLWPFEKKTFGVEGHEQDIEIAGTRILCRLFLRWGCCQYRGCSDETSVRWWSAAAAGKRNEWRQLTITQQCCS